MIPGGMESSRPKHANRSPQTLMFVGLLYVTTYRMKKGHLEAGGYFLGLQDS